MEHKFIRTADNSVWVRGDRERGADVIAALERKGGANTRHLHGTIPEYGYYIDHNGEIDSVNLMTQAGLWMQGAWGELEPSRRG